MGRFHAVWVATLFLTACDSASDNSDTILVYAHNAPQCEQLYSLASSTQELIDAGIDVLGSWCGHEAGAYCAACGCPSGHILVHEIRTTNVPDARLLGFLPVGALDYRREECPVP